MANGKTTNYGLDTVGPEGNLADDGHKALVADRQLIDAWMHWFANHHHTGTTSSVDAPAEPDLEVGESGGAFVGGQRFYYVVALLDPDGIESAASESVFIDLPGVITPPGLSPLIEAFTTGGTLFSGFHQYVFTAYTDGDPNRETSPSESVFANVEANGSGRVEVTYPEVPEGADGWNIYRLAPMAIDYLRIRSISVAAAALEDNVFTDDGSYPEEANRRLPTSNNTSASNSVVVTFPGGVPLGHTWKVYRTGTDGVWASTLIQHVTAPLSPGSPYTTDEFIDIGQDPIAGTPLTASTTFQNPEPVDLSTETTGVIPWSRVANASVPTTQAGDGTVDIAGLPRANAYHCAVDDGTLRFLLPAIAQERQFVLFLNPDTALPTTPTWWTVDDPDQATPDVVATTPIWYTANPFTAETTATVAIMVQVVETAAGTWHYALMWFNGAGITGGSGDLDGYAQLAVTNTFTQPQTLEISVPVADLEDEELTIDDIIKAIVTLVIPEVGEGRIADLIAARILVAPGLISTVIGLRAKEFDVAGDLTGDDLLLASSYSAHGLPGFRALKAPDGNVIAAVGYNLLAGRVAVSEYVAMSDWTAGTDPTPEDVPNRVVIEGVAANLEQYVDDATAEIPASNVAYDNVLTPGTAAVLTGSAPGNDFMAGNAVDFDLVINGQSYPHIGAAAFSGFTYAGDHSTTGVSRLQNAINVAINPGDEVTVTYWGGYVLTTTATGLAATIEIDNYTGGATATGFADGDLATGPDDVRRYPALPASTTVQAVLNTLS